MHTPRLRQFAFACMALLIAAPAFAQSTRSDDAGPLVAGDSIAAAPAVSGLKIVSDNWPDPSSLRQFGLDAIRLEGAETAEQKALAIWRWVRMVTTAAAGGVPCEPGSAYISEPHLILNVYGDHHCDGLSRLMASVYKAAVGLPAWKLYRAGHTMADCWWVDDDGVGRYHMFDVNYGYFLYSRDGGHIVTCDDIGMDYSLEALPSRTARPWLEKQWWMNSWIHVGWPELLDYDGTMGLRPGEQALRLWGNMGRPYDDGALSAGPDPDSAPYPRTYGNGRFYWSEDFFGGDAWKARLAVPPVNTSVLAGLLGQEDPNRPAELIYRGRFPYVVADVDLSLLAGRAGTIRIDTSVDGGRTWREAWTLAAEAGKSARLRLSDVQPKYDGGQTPSDPRARTRVSRTTPLGRYDYLLRIRLDDGAWLKAISCATTVQLNYLVLPNLRAGDNRITVSGTLSPGHALRVAYVFHDADAQYKRHEVVIDSLPFSYTIQAAGRTWKDVLCRSITVTAERADGQGSRVVAAPAAAKVLPEGPMPRLDIRALNGIVPESSVLQPAEERHRYKVMTDAEVWELNKGPFEPRLKTVEQYVAELASAEEDRRRYAAAGLTVLRDPAAWGPLEKLALADTTRAKYYAIQALFWTDAERAWPVLEKLLRRDPSARFAPDARGRVEQPTYLNVSALVAALCGQAKIKAAVPLIADVLVNHSRDWPEPRWGMIRALGRIGDPSAIPTVRRFARGGGADTNVVAIEALAELNDRESIPLMGSFLESRGYNIRPEAGLAALTRLDAAGYTEQAIALLDHWREERRWLAAEYLGRCGDPDKAIPALTAAMEKEEFAHARERMAAAIERLQAARPRPAGDQ